MPRIVIIGAGLSGLATAHYLVKSLSDAGKEAEILLLEADAVPGGKMRTIRQDGFSMEWGPNGFLTNKPYGMELVKELGIRDRLARSSDLARKRFILSGGKLHRLPETPPAFFRSHLLSLPGRLRILWEPFASGPPAGVDESLGEFARRRLGPETLEKLIGTLTDAQHAPAAEALLKRYTEEKFQTPDQWRDWLEKSRGRIYFTDVGGYKFLVVPEGYLLAPKAGLPAATTAPHP